VLRERKELEEESELKELKEPHQEELVLKEPKVLKGLKEL